MNKIGGEKEKSMSNFCDKVLASLLVSHKFAHGVNEYCYNL